MLNKREQALLEKLQAKAGAPEPFKLNRADQKRIGEHLAQHGTTILVLGRSGKLRLFTRVGHSSCVKHGKKLGSKKKQEAAPAAT